uniref:Large ribosomal subunit protein bL21m n=1 Tax=Paulinella longichromatophora TaxID=1708747 RepID=A0A2H4ZQL1_9EUKA|nr:50S ribosomal protein L21 [Paulinella longichromatophora]
MSTTINSDVYAIVETSGQQFWLQPSRYYDLDRLQAKLGEIVTLDNVLLIKNDKKTILGQPYIKDAVVELEVMTHRRGPKLIVYKMRPKKKTRRKNGHRQNLTRVMVKSISIDGNLIS